MVGLRDIVKHQGTLFKQMHFRVNRRAKTSGFNCRCLAKELRRKHCLDSILPFPGMHGHRVLVTPTPKIRTTNITYDHSCGLIFVWVARGDQLLLLLNPEPQMRLHSPKSGLYRAYSMYHGTSYRLRV